MDVAKILITGMSATGKSTLLVELARRGHRVVDLDDGWSVEVPAPDGSGREQLWRADLVAALLREDSGVPLFVAGCASNQGTFYDRFDAVVLLSVPREVLLGRLAARETNRFGRGPAERDRILADLAAVEPRLRATATVELDTQEPLHEVADTVEAIARSVDL
jgi:dephospho-CoA kinase